jgi:hypothetical protein
MGARKKSFSFGAKCLASFKLRGPNVSAVFRYGRSKGLQIIVQIIQKTKIGKIFFLNLFKDRAMKPR